jgi:hypothetical protein
MPEKTVVPEGRTGDHRSFEKIGDEPPVYPGVPLTAAAKATAFNPAERDDRESA